MSLKVDEFVSNHIKNCYDVGNEIDWHDLCVEVSENCFGKELEHAIIRLLNDGTLKESRHNTLIVKNL